MDSVRAWLCYSNLLSNGMADKNTGFSSNHTWHNMLCQKVKDSNFVLLQTGGIFLKVIVVEAPKLIKPLMRMIFKIKKVNY